MEIHVDDLREFERRIDARDTLSLEEHRGYLSTLVDRELLIGSARELELLEKAELQAILQRNSTKKLAEIMFDREVLGRATPTPEEIEASYASGDWQQQVVSVELFLPDEKTALRVRQEILDGLDVYDAARLYSVDRMMHLPMGGAQQFIYSRFDGPAEIVQRVFKIPAGNLSSPIPFRRGYVLAYVAEYRTVEREDIADEIRRHVGKEKRKMLRGAYLQHLNKELQLEFSAAGLKRVIEHLSRRRIEAAVPMPQDSALVVYSHSGSKHTLSEVIRFFSGSATLRDTLDPSQLIAKIKNTILPDLLMAEDARRKGVDSSQPFLSWKATRSEDLMLSLLQREVCKAVSVEQDEIIAHYRKSIKRFRIPGYARVRDLLVASQEEAMAFKKQVDEGADFALLARENSQRSDKKKDVFRVFVLQAKRFGSAWMNYAMNIPIGEVHGPIEAEGGYALIQVVERFADSYYTLDESRVRSAVTRDLQNLKERRHFNAYVQETRQRHREQTVVYAESLSNLVGR